MQIKYRLIAALILTCTSSAFAQKQSENLPAPAAVKIDGKINEWTSPFQVNKPTKLSYIIANDQKNLYLVIKSEDSLVNARILMTGIDFMVNTAGKKKEGPFVMFPLIPRAPRTRGAGGQIAASAVPLAELVAAHRKAIADIKEIKVSGFKDITDPTISIYNEYGIKGAAAIDDKANFLYELAIPLTMFGLTAESGQEVAYNIKINGSDTQNMRGAGGGGFGGGPGGGGPGGGGGNFGGGGFGGGGESGGRGGDGGNRQVQNRFYEASDFWVTYKLTKP